MSAKDDGIWLALEHKLPRFCPSKTQKRNQSMFYPSPPPCLPTAGRSQIVLVICVESTKGGTVSPRAPRLRRRQWKMRRVAAIYQRLRDVRRLQWGPEESRQRHQTCEAGHDGIDAASPLAASAAGRMEASTIGERGGRDREGRGEEGFSSSCRLLLPLKALTPTTPPSLWCSAEMPPALFSPFSLSRAVCVSAGVEEDDRTPIGARGEWRGRESLSQPNDAVPNPAHPPSSLL